MSIRIFKDDQASAIFVARGTVGTWPLNCLQAIGESDGTVSVRNKAKEYADESNFLEISHAAYTEFIDESGDAWGADQTDVVDNLNAIFSASGAVDGTAPVITSSLAVALTEGDTLNYELTATDGVGYEWDLSNVPGVTTVEGNVRKLIGGSSLGVASYNIPVKAINYYGVDSETVVLTVSSPPFSDTYSVNFEQNDYLSATADSSNPFYRSSNGDGSAWSISFWFKAGTSNNQNQTVISYGGNDASNEGRVQVVYDGKSDRKWMRLQYGSNNNRLLMVTPASSVTSGTWEHWLITFDGGTTGASSGDIADYYSRFAFYKNGSLQTKTNDHNNYGFTGAMPTDTFLVGESSGGGQHMRNGCRLDEIALWESDESSNVAAIYNSGSTHDLSALGSAPDHWWRMGDGDTYPTLQDSVASLEFTMNNMTSSEIVSDVP